MNPDRRIVGIDVSKGKIDFHCLPDKTSGTVKDQDFAKFTKKLVDLKPDLIIMEATGGYERPLLRHLMEAQLPIAVVNPAQARHFAGANGTKAKTDSIDAKMLAMFGKQLEIEARPMPSQEQQELQDLYARRRQLIEMQTMETNRLYQTFSPKVKKSLEKHLKSLGKQIDEIDEEIDSRIKESPIWRENEQLLKSIPGIGEQTAHALQALLPELGNMSNSQISSMVGVAPHPRDSGKWNGVRTIKGGRAEVRCALYMPTLTATRCNPAIKRFYDRLIDKGKSFKVAITACMHKLLIIANSIVKNKTPFSAKTA
jgi:transposase